MKLLQKFKEKINGEKIIYHGRIEGGLTKIEPHKCKHKKAYVYASYNIPLCIIFGVKRTGENIDFGVTKFGKTYITEFYEGAFEDRFKNRPCYLYKLKEKDFKLDTEYFERVSEKPVEVVDCVEIKDSAEYLLNLAKKRKLKLTRFNKLSKKQITENTKILTKRITDYLIFKEASKEEYKNLDRDAKIHNDITLERKNFCLKKFPELVKQIEESLKNKSNQ